MNKKILLSLVLVLVIILLGGGYYVLIVQKAAPAAAPSTSSTNTSVFPTDSNRPLGGSSSGGGFGELTATGTPGSNSTNNQLASRFSRLSTDPIASVAALGRGATSSVWYIEKNTGHLYRTNAEGAGEIASNTTIPKILDLVMAKPGNPFIIRYNKDGRPQNYLATLATTSTELSGRFLPQSAYGFAISPDRNSFAFLEVVNNKTQLVTSDWQYKKPTVLASSDLDELTLNWVATSTILLTTKPSATVPGYTYSFDLKTKQLTRLIDNVPGLSILPSPDGKHILYSGSGSNRPFLAVYDLKKQVVNRISLPTLVNKCVWASDSLTVYCGAPTEIPSSSYPDNWLSGEVSLNDKLWQVNATTGSSQLLFNPSLQDNKATFDVYQIALNEALDRLYIINKIDLSLWVLDLRLGF